MAAKQHYLFGYPISHSASPTLHNNVWKELGEDRHFALCETQDVQQPHMREMVKSDNFAGAAVTMPLKVTILATGILDELSPSAKAVGAINTIVVETGKGGRRFVGTNTDVLGVRNSLLRQLALSAGLPDSTYTSPSSAGPSAFPLDRFASFIIGGGGTTRASIYALAGLNLSPIYLINRDPEETAAIVSSFPSLDLRPLHSIDAWERDRSSPSAREIPLGVGCIPAIEPQTEGEKTVYELAHRFFDAPYRPDRASGGAEGIPPPVRRHFLEMAYKPRRTPMLIRAESAGWVAIEGVQAMIEQGFAQDRMWLLGDSSASVASLTGPDGPIPPPVEAKVRRLVADMGDVKVEKQEEVGGPT